MPNAPFGSDEAVEVTLPANSWNTLTEPNGCQIMFPDAIVVPTRRLRRPISLSIGAVVKVETIPFAPTPPLILNESTLVLDQMKPADGSMNQLLASAKLYPADTATETPCAPTCWPNKTNGGIVQVGAVEFLTHHDVGEKAAMGRNQVGAEERHLEVTRSAGAGGGMGRQIARGGAQMNVPAAPVKPGNVLPDLHAGKGLAHATRAICCRLGVESAGGNESRRQR